MNEAECVRRLWTRARARVAQHHARNLSGEAVERCLVCGAEAALREKSRAEHVFCAEHCQRRLHFFGRAFSALGMVKDESDEEGGDDNRRPARKRGVEALEEAHPEVYEVWLPDEVVCSLILWAFDFRLRTEAEYDELREMRSVSRRYLRIIDDCVRPQLRELPTRMLQSMEEAEVLRFPGLERLALSYYYWPNLTGALLPALHHLDDVTIDGVTWGETGLKVTDAEVQSLRRVRRLELIHIYEGGTLSDAALDGLVWVEELSLANTFFSDGCLAPMKHLHRLRLSENTNVLDLTPLAAGLTSLALLDTNFVSQESLRALVNLELLTIDGNDVLYDETVLEDMAHLRGLDVRNCQWVTNATLAPLTALVSLLLDGAEVSDGALERLTALRALSLEGSHLVASDVRVMTNLTWLNVADSVVCGEYMTRLTSLTYLDVGANKRRSYIRDEHIAPLVSLTTLLMDDTQLLSGSCFRSLSHLTVLSIEESGVRGKWLRFLVNLRVLNLHWNSEVRDAHLVTLTRLEELYLTRNTLITDLAVRKLPALRVIAVHQWHLSRERMRAALRAQGLVVLDIESAWSNRRELLQQPLHFDLSSHARFQARARRKKKAGPPKELVFFCAARAAWRKRTSGGGITSSAPPVLSPAPAFALERKARREINNVVCAPPPAL